MRYKLLGYLLLILLLAAIVSATLVWQAGHRPTPPVVVHVITNKTLADQAKTIQVNYPSNYTLSSDTGIETSGLIKTATEVGVINIPASLYPQTNFVGGYAHISTVADSSASDCQQYVTGGSLSNKFTKTELINGINFYTANFTGAAAGNLYDTKIYHTFHKDTCYEVALTLHTTNIGNFDPASGVSEVNATDIWDKLNSILKTFKFTN